MTPEGARMQRKEMRRIARALRMLRMAPALAAAAAAMGLEVPIVNFEEEWLAITRFDQLTGESGLTSSED
jgi:hypothetical protein